jgi:probable F420-dependent oxidoreductase
MKFGLMFANAGPFCFPEMVTHLATTAERVGVESIWTVEHVVIPVGYESAYPYDASGKMPAPDQLPLPDPLVWLAYAAAVTKKLRLATGVVILPQRHPLYVAKELATLDVLSHGRVIFGIGVGWLQEEFRALGVPFDERAARTSETVRAIRSLWKDEAEPFEGKFFRWGKLESNPKPVQKPGVPIVVGGHTEIAARRAARYGDGFFPGVTEEEKLTHLLAVMRDECRKVGRDPKTIEVTSGRGLPTQDNVKRMRDLGSGRTGTYLSF